MVQSQKRNDPLKPENAAGKFCDDFNGSLKKKRMGMSVHVTGSTFPNGNRNSSILHLGIKRSAFSYCFPTFLVAEAPTPKSHPSSPSRIVNLDRTSPERSQEKPAMDGQSNCWLLCLKISPSPNFFTEPVCRKGVCEIFKVVVCIFDHVQIAKQYIESAESNRTKCHRFAKLEVVPSIPCKANGANGDSNKHRHCDVGLLRQNRHHLQATHWQFKDGSARCDSSSLDEIDKYCGYHMVS